MHYQFNVKVVHTLTHLILPGHPTLPFEGFRGKYSVGQAHTYPCGQVYGFDRREGVARPESKHQIIIICMNEGPDFVWLQYARTYRHVVYCYQQRFLK